jgi:putative ABC transport system permease protein
VSSTIMNDVRVVLRGLLKTPGTACIVVLTLALAIGANTAIFSVVQSVLLQPLPYPDEDRIVYVAATTYQGGDRGSSFSDRGYWHFVDNNRVFEQFGGVWGDWFTLTGDGAPRQVLLGYMTLSAFEVLGVFPEHGRLPTPEEDTPGGPSVVLLSHELWVSRYGGDPSILGRTVDLNGMPQEVIGVMPAGYDHPTAPLDIDLWAPMQLDPASADFGSVYITAIARLRPGVTIEAAISDARSLVARFDEAGYEPSWFETVFDGGAVVRPLREVIVEDTREPLLILLGTVGFVLLIACSNVANLLLVRAEGRRRENAVRLALGSSRARLARHVALESALLALLGGIGGVLLAHAGTSALVAMAPASIPRLGEIAVDGTALVFTAGVSLLAALLFGVLPALASSSTNTLGLLRDGGRGSTIGRARHRTRNVLVMTQVALAFVLVIGSGLMVRSFAALHSVDPGFSTANLLTFTVQPLPTKYEDAQAVARFYDRLIERLEAVPGVTRAGAINTLPLAGWGCCWMPSVIEEFPPAEGQRPPEFFHRRTTPGYFEAMSIPVVEGRAFTPDDHNHRLASVIISRSVKDRYWPDTSALGKRIVLGGTQTQVVGVVGDVHRALDIAPDQMLYRPMLDAEGAPSVMPLEAMTLTLRTAVEPLSLVNAIRTAIAEVDPDVPMADVRSMQRVLGDSVSRTRFTMSLLVIAALIALFLGAVGLYGVLCYVVSQRAPEIGVRLALGASPRAMRGMVVSQGLRLVSVGVLIGLVAAVALGRVMVTQLYGVHPVDPVTLAAAAAVFLTVAVFASVLPAGRAAGVAPMDTLRVS